TGANYQNHPLSTGPYKFSSYQLNKQYVLVPNPMWNPSWDPQVKQLASKVIVNLNVNAHDIANRLMAGEIHVDHAGSAVQPTTRSASPAGTSRRPSSSSRCAVSRTASPPTSPIAATGLVRWRPPRRSRPRSARSVSRPR